MAEIRVAGGRSAALLAAFGSLAACAMSTDSKRAGDASQIDAAIAACRSPGAAPAQIEALRRAGFRAPRPDDHAELADLYLDGLTLQLYRGRTDAYDIQQWRAAKRPQQGLNVALSSAKMLRPAAAGSVQAVSTDIQYSLDFNTPTPHCRIWIGDLKRADALRATLGTPTHMERSATGAKYSYRLAGEDAQAPVLIEMWRASDLVALLVDDPAFRAPVHIKLQHIPAGYEMPALAKEAQP